MRAVGMDELRAFMDTMKAIDETSKRHMPAIVRSQAQVAAAMAAGKRGEALRVGAAALTDWQLAVVALGVRYEKAAVALLGEHRRPDERVEDYVQRTVAVAQDFEAMRAMQLEHGMVWVGEGA